MTEIFEGNTRLEAWVRATDSLFHDSDRNVGKFKRADVILDIESPADDDALDSELLPKLDDLYEDNGMEPTHAIAEWIFPGSLYQREGIEGVYETYPEQMESISELYKTRWGTYAQRIIQQEDPDDGSDFKPLENLIDKMRKNHGSNSPMGSIYELGIHQGPYDIPLYDSAKDRNRWRGGPCLSHLSFKLIEGHVQLTALYRYHDYRYKVPGNLLGLARLQTCVAHEVGAGIGKLVVHSSRAFINDDGGYPEFRDLTDELSDRIDSRT